MPIFARPCFFDAACVRGEPEVRTPLRVLKTDPTPSVCNTDRAEDLPVPQRRALMIVFGYAQKEGMPYQAGRKSLIKEFRGRNGALVGHGAA